MLCLREVSGLSQISFWPPLCVEFLMPSGPIGLTLWQTGLHAASNISSSDCSRRYHNVIFVQRGISFQTIQPKACVCFCKRIELEVHFHRCLYREYRSIRFLTSQELSFSWVCIPLVLRLSPLIEGQKVFQQHRTRKLVYYLRSSKLNALMSASLFWPPAFVF